MKPLIAASLLVCALQSAENQSAGDLTAAQSKAVLGLAENALRAQDLWKGKVFLTNTEVLVDQSASPPLRYALLTFYRTSAKRGSLLANVVGIVVHDHSFRRCGGLYHLLRRRRDAASLPAPTAAQRPSVAAMAHWPDRSVAALLLPGRGVARLELLGDGHENGVSLTLFERGSFQRPWRPQDLWLC